MAGESKIEWAHSTFNPVIGCQKVSPGCENCYAEADMDTRRHRAKWGPFKAGGTRSVVSESTWQDPYRWRAAYLKRLDEWAEAGRPADLVPERPRVFCASLSDVFEAWEGSFVDHKGYGVSVGTDGMWYSSRAGVAGTPLTVTDVRVRLFRTIKETPELDWLLLTKRPENVRPALNAAYYQCEDRPTSNMLADWEAGDPPPNVWLGVSVEDQARVVRAGQLLSLPAARRFVSAEPLIGPVDFGPQLGRLDLVIVGGESGGGSRGCHVDWVRSIVWQCGRAGVACFVKQLGARPFSGNGSQSGTIDLTVRGIKQKKGNDPAEWPADLRVRQLPATVTR